MAEPETDKVNPNPEAAKPAQGAANATRVDATKYVGTPAVGTSKAAAAAGLASPGPSNTVLDKQRRRFVWVMVTAFLTAWFLSKRLQTEQPRSVQSGIRPLLAGIARLDYAHPCCHLNLIR